MINYGCNCQDKNATLGSILPGGPSVHLPWDEYAQTSANVPVTAVVFMFLFYTNISSYRHPSTHLSNYLFLNKNMANNLPKLEERADKISLQSEAKGVFTLGKGMSQFYPSPQPSSRKIIFKSLRTFFIS